MQSQFVPQLGREVTRLGLGALPMGPLQKGISPAEGAAVIRRALESGVTFFDTATVYGTYEHLARGLEGWPAESITVATKTHARDDRALAEQHIELALRALGREPIDIMLCHCARSAFTWETWGPTLEALLAAKERGWIRMVGLSSHSIEGVRVAAAMPEIEVIHPLINVAGLGITDGSASEMLAAIEKAHANGKLLYAMKALGGGNLVSRRREALEFVWNQPSIDILALGMVTPQEVDWNVRWALGQPIPEALEEATAVNTKRISILGFVCTGCGSCVEHCENDALHLVDGKAQVDHDRCILCGYCAPHCPLFAVRVT